MEAIHEFKLRYLKQLSSVNSLSNSWEIWGEKLNNLIDEDNWGESAFNIGDNLINL